MAVNIHNARYTVTGFSPEYDWRPTEFEEPVDPAKICASCKVLSRSTALLGCSHALCEPCFTITLHKEQRCPVEDAAYTEGTLRELPSHFYSKCTYQTVTCDRCQKEVLRSDMMDHRYTCTPCEYNLETKLNSLVEHIHHKEGAGVTKPELLTAAIGLLRSIGLLSLATTWRPHGLAVVVSRVRYFAKQVPEYAEEVYSAPSDVCGYSLRLGVRCERKLVLISNRFEQLLTLSIVHPDDSTKEVRFFLNTSMMSSEAAFQMPGCEDNPPFSIGGPLHVAALAGCQFWSYGTLQLRSA
ncbi:hypothetical protein HPB48_001530 [Haemaphysalis longicornis]|uniref:RING-type domain-containing protein n=1 Tax=Haemaphysalis longicornis TaxID=44386 RepID=A0A9J6H122_HAELO|nr:hypothetical protein HPB48_001530 [Haemaphysalis longicornis]